MSLFEQTKTTQLIQDKLLVFDIETVPSFPLNDLQLDYLDKKLQRNIDRGTNSGLGEEEHKRKISSLDPYLGKVACICVYFPNSDITREFYGTNEKQILKDFWNLISTFDGVFISYNGRNFDIPFIIRRSMLYGIKPTNREFLSYTKFNPYPPHYDVLIELCGRDLYWSLEQACDFFDIDNPKSGEITNSTVYQAYLNGKHEQIAEYCSKDLKATYAVFQRIKYYTYYR